MRRVGVAVIGVALAALLTGVMLSADDAVGEELRRQFAKLSPYRILAVVGVVALGSAMLSFARNAGASWPQAARFARALHVRAIAVPAGLALPLFVGIAAGLRISLNEAVALPGVFADELIYANLAKSFAEEGALVLRGVQDNGHSILYPILISPAYALAEDGVAAYRAVQIVNALAISLAAVPAYYLARRVTTHGWSLTVAALSVFIPSTAYSALVMTESLFYPIFVTTALAVTLMLERPTIARQLLVAGLVLALVAVRTQALALIPAVATAVVVDGLRISSLRSRLSVFWPAGSVLGGLAVLAVIASQVGAEAPTGAYGPLLDAYNPLDVARWAVWNIAGYELAVGVVALAALPLALMQLLRAEASAAEGALGAATLALFGWLVASVAVLSASPYGLDVLHQRSLFFVTPLVLACFAYWLAGGLWRPLSTTLGVAVVSIAVVLVLPSRLFMSGAYVDAPTNVLWVGLSERITDVPVEWFVAGAAIVGTAVFLRARTPALPLLAFVITILFVNANLVWRSTITRDDAKRLGWVDQALGAGEHATIVHVAVDSDRCPSGSESYQGEAVAWTEFFNKSVDRVYGVLGEVRDDGLATPQLSIADDGTLADAAGTLAPDYAVVDSRVRIVGTELATLNLHDFPGFDTARSGSLTLWRPEKPLRLVFPGPLREGRPEQIACP